MNGFDMDPEKGRGGYICSHPNCAPTICPRSHTLGNLIKSELASCGGKPSQCGEVQQVVGHMYAKVLQIKWYKKIINQEKNIMDENMFVHAL